jgi:hypothetical protein
MKKSAEEFADFSFFEEVANFLERRTEDRGGE